MHIRAWKSGERMIDGTFIWREEGDRQFGFHEETKMSWVKTKAMKLI